jgi:hypothetical protein
VVLGLSFALGCAPIDVNSEVTVRPREAPAQQFGVEQLDRRDFVADWVQLGPRLLVQVREHPSCVAVRHMPVMRTEEIRRTSRGFVIWDFVLGTVTGGFAALAFAKPQLFTPRLVDGQGRVVYETSSAYIVGGLFAAISAGLFAAGVVNALRSRDTVRHAEAYEVELGPAHPCASLEDGGTPVRERALRLIVGEGELELEAQTDDEGRARFELSSWAGAVPTSGELPAVIHIDDEQRVLVLSLRVPFDGMVEAHTGIADTRRKSAPIEGPMPAPEEQP